MVVAVCSLRGCPETGKGSLPNAIDDVLLSHTLWGGLGTPQKILDRLAEQGRAYIMTTI